MIFSLLYLDKICAPFLLSKFFLGPSDHAKNLQKKLWICEKFLHCFSLFEVLYNWVKFRRLKMGVPVYTLEHCFFPYL